MVEEDARGCLFHDLLADRRSFSHRVDTKNGCTTTIYDHLAPTLAPTDEAKGVGSTGRPFSWHQDENSP